MENLLNKKPGVYVVKDILGGHGCKMRFYELGIYPGKRITLISSGDKGPILVRIGNTKIALGKGLAGRIIVE
ncbi:FeoA family protein [Methanotorris formicicus]|uniref:FeoA family protein n=1 Tax=Methanotorris formicicus Mc-S-70 TaxID=647171 RepID=H1KXH7_9EURY|nr:FeoA domain-containing protein [Methanotorris formicicus]EHP88280.1 FeoA family protein [Methanotorris formicicus Mc-S-70]